jgi:hypothetical protein
MLDRSVDARQENYPAAGLDVAETVRELSSRELAPLVSKIDSEGLYPESVMRAFGRAGAFARHLPGGNAGRPRSCCRDPRDGCSRRALPVDRVLHVVPERARLVHLRLRERGS